MADPYATLGVRKNASKATVKRAYRKKAMLHHPDRNGDRQKFEHTQLAYRILSDDEKRKRFDETGSVDEKPDNAQTHAMGAVAMAFGNVMAAICQDKPYRLAYNVYNLIDVGRNQVDELLKIVSACEYCPICKQYVAVIEPTHGGILMACKDCAPEFDKIMEQLKDAK